MKLGFYLETNGGTPQNVEIYNFLNKEVENKTLDDAAVFFNTVNFNPVSNNFGMFNGTELWHFSGNLITTDLINTVRAKNVVNKIKLAYLFSTSDVKEGAVFELGKISREIRVFVTSESDGKEFYRLTGVKPKVIGEFSLEEIKGVFDE